MPASITVCSGLHRASRRVAMALVATTEYTDPGLTADTTYAYSVTAADAAGIAVNPPTLTLTTRHPGHHRAGTRPSGRHALSNTKSH